MGSLSYPLNDPIAIDANIPIYTGELTPPYVAALEAGAATFLTNDAVSRQVPGLSMVTPGDPPAS